MDIRLSKSRAAELLAAVAAGITMSYAERSGQALAVTRVRRSVVWDAIQFAANGTIFVLLGAQLPRIVIGAEQAVSETGHHRPIWLLIYAIAINGALAALRFLWVFTSLRLTKFRATCKGQKPPAPSWRLIAATSLAGVRGAVTLAGVMTLPLTLTDGSGFPARQLAIFLAASVILLSLIIASIGLPYLLKGLELPPEPSHQEEEDRARIAAAHAAIAAIKRARGDLEEGRADAELYDEVGGRIMELYLQRIEGHSRTGASGHVGAGPGCGWAGPPPRCLIHGRCPSRKARESRAFFHCSAKARSMTKSPGFEVLPSLKPRSSSITFRSFSRPGLPQIITRSSAGESGGTPRSVNSVPLAIRSVTRPWYWKGSRVTVG